MPSRNTSFIILQNGLSILLLFIGLSFISSPTCADQTIYTLNEVANGNISYFYNATDKSMIVGSCDGEDASGSMDSTNVIVWAKDNDVHALVNEWQDTKGRFHSVAILKQQLQFNTDFKKAFKKRNGQVYTDIEQLSDCNDGDSDYSDDLWFDRLNHCRPIGPLYVTGIFDRDVLFIPYWKAVVRFTLAYHRFMHECKKAGGQECHNKPWPNAYFDILESNLNSASDKIKALDNTLNSVPIIRQESNDVIQGVPYPGPGLSISLSYRNTKYLHIESLNKSQCAITDGDVDYQMVNFLISPSVIDDDLLNQINTEVSEINAALAQEEYTADGIFGPEHP